MEGEIDAMKPLDYIELQIFPSQNRYEASICQGENIETVASADFEPLLLHLPAIKVLHAKGLDAKYKLLSPDAPNGVRWFTKSALLSFLHVISLPEVLKATNAAKNEISQLEEARMFHFSLYAKGQILFEDERAGNTLDGNAPNLKVEISSYPLDESKNELIQAIDLRLNALRGELTTAFAKAAGATCCDEKMDDLEKFCHHFGATDLRDSLCKLVELNQETHPAGCDSRKLSTNSSGHGKIVRNQEINKNSPIQSDIPVKYNASPAKAAQVERESSSECGESSCSSEAELVSVERSRTVVRSASPGRSASPMRRVQIGRSGSRRATALTIKSLSYFPRERFVPQKDAAAESTDEEASEQPSKKSESNVRQMSVQDAISLFEGKQRDQSVDGLKTMSSSSAAVGANKSVLRRWSAGAGENLSHGRQGVVSEVPVPLPSNNLESGDMKNGPSEAKLEYDLSSEGDQVLPTKVEIRRDSPEQSSSPIHFQENPALRQTTEISEELIDSAEWSRQKEAELNQLPMKMIETKPTKYHTRAPEATKGQSLPSEQKGGFYNHYKEKRNEKLLQESTRKREEKEKQFRAMQQILDERKVEMASANGCDAGRKGSTTAQKPQKTSSVSANPKNEILKPSVKKVAPKASLLPATRKSWPSTPSPRPAGISPAKTSPGMTSAGTTLTRKKPQAAPSVPQSSPKVERTQPKLSSVKATRNDAKKIVKDVNEKKQQSLKKPTKSTKSKLESVNVAEPASSAKPRFYSKVTKKSSVVPVEAKPFLRKGSGIGSGASPVSRTKVSSKPEEALTCTGDLKPDEAEENEIVSGSSNHASELDVNIGPSKDQVGIESGFQVSQEKYEQIETSDEVNFSGGSFPMMAEPFLNAKDADETMISPSAWVEIEEHDEQPAPSSDSIFQTESPDNVVPVRMPNQRVRHSLSQMLMEDSSEPDMIEWGNTENPPSLVYPKDVPKGFKRLLKFARKSKTETNSTGWSSPSVFSEGEDDSEESNLVVKRSAENLLKKATLHAKNLGPQKASSHYKNLAAHETFAQANVSKFIAQKLQDGQISAPSNMSKASRSFFSLSAFKGANRMS